MLLRSMPLPRLLRAVSWVMVTWLAGTGAPSTKPAVIIPSPNPGLLAFSTVKPLTVTHDVGDTNAVEAVRWHVDYWITYADKVDISVHSGALIVCIPGHTSTAPFQVAPLR